MHINSLHKSQERIRTSKSTDYEAVRDVLVIIQVAARCLWKGDGRSLLFSPGEVLPNIEKVCRVNRLCVKMDG